MEPLFDLVVTVYSQLLLFEEPKSIKDRNHILEPWTERSEKGLLSRREAEKRIS